MAYMSIYNASKNKGQIADTLVLSGILFVGAGLDPPTNPMRLNIIKCVCREWLALAPYYLIVGAGLDPLQL
eukprot:4503749-Pleurochrysis_carterae.AAC.1